VVIFTYAACFPYRSQDLWSCRVCTKRRCWHHCFYLRIIRVSPTYGLRDLVAYILSFRVIILSTFAFCYFCRTEPRTKTVKKEKKLKMFTCIILYTHEHGACTLSLRIQHLCSRAVNTGSVDTAHVSTARVRRYHFVHPWSRAAKTASVWIQHLVLLAYSRQGSSPDECDGQPRCCRRIKPRSDNRIDQDAAEGRIYV